MRIADHGIDSCARLRLARIKKKHPERYKHVLVICGPFHTHGHFLFAGQESYHDSYTGYFGKVLHREKVPKHIPDFSNDSFRHILAHTLEITIGSYVYFISDVQNPPPDMLLSQPAMYEASIRKAGGQVAFKYLLHVGCPNLHWIRAGRESNGDTCEKLHAHSFHINRATTHKINCVLISLLSLLSTTAVDPIIADMVKALVSTSITGKTYVYGDRAMEYFNNLQGQRDGKFASFENAIHYSPSIEAMLHAALVWDVAEKGESPINDPVLGT